MDEHRRSRFVALFNDAKGPFKGSREKLIAKTGLTKGRVSQLFDESQPFGELAARNLAAKLDLPPDFFERGHQSTTGETAGSPITERQRKLLGYFSELSEAEQEVVLNDVHGRAARTIGDRILANRFDVTGYAGDQALPEVFHSLLPEGERRVDAEPAPEKRRNQLLNPLRGSRSRGAA